MAWCPNDKNHFFDASRGEISPDNTVARLLTQCIQENDLKNILEIGTWNGLGSTTVFLSALKNKASAANFISLESNVEKNSIAKNNCKHLMGPNTQLVNGVILKPDDIQDMDIIFPSFRNNSEFQRWHSIDMKNVENSPYVLDMIPETLDFVLFDGGEFTTYYEFEKLLPRCTKFIAMDDVNGDKCRLARKILNEHAEWKEIAYISERAGFALFQKVA